MAPSRVARTVPSVNKLQRVNKECNDKVDMKMTIGTVSTTMLQRSQLRERRPVRVSAAKKVQSGRNFSSKVRSSGRRMIDPCDNSNDSGLGFDQHVDTNFTTERLSWTEEPAYKRSKLEIKLENDEINDNFGFPETVRCKENTSLIRTAPIGTTTAFNITSNQSTTSGRAVPRCIPLTNRNLPTSPITLTTQLATSSKLADITLSILCQPEQQHRARYQTEGSRGAVKDRSGNGFPIVQLSGYSKPATLQVFIGTDCGKVSPHMFYQACRVSGKNSTPCTETKLEGTIVIELQLDPTKDMTVTCDCVGILKERNVDVEHRFPNQLGSRTKKKSTRCRMVFRTTITHDDGFQETLQVCSQPIVCTQPPGIPEICKKSLSSCPATGGLELFVLGKNFLKDTLVFFQQTDDSNNVIWEQSVTPDKEFLQQTHLVCVIPPYLKPNITEPVTVRLYVASSGKSSETQDFIYTPIGGVVASVPMETRQPTQFLNKLMWPSANPKQDDDSGMMPPPESIMVPLLQRRPSTNMSQMNGEPHSPPMHVLKQEILDENSQNSLLEPGRFRYISEGSLDVHNGDSNLSMMTENSVDMVRRPSLSSDVSQSNLNENSNLSLVNESNGLRSISNSMDGNPDCSNMSTIHEESSVHLDMAGSNGILSQAKLFHGEMLPMQARIPQTCITQTCIPQTCIPQTNGLTVVDLCLRTPLATVADLVSTNAPSMATLQTFGVTEATNSPLPAQSAQSVENYLNKIETNKPAGKVDIITGQIVTQANGILNMSSQELKQEIMKQEIMKQDIMKGEMMKREIMKQGMMKDDVMKQEMMKQEIMKQEMMKQEMMKQEMMKQEMMKQEMMKQEMMKQEMMKQDMMPQEMMTQEMMKQEMMKQEMMKQEMMKQEMMKQDMMKQDMMKQDMMKQDMMKQDMMKQDMMKQDMMNQDMMKQDTMEQNMMKQEMMKQEMMKQGMMNQEMMNQGMMKQEMMKQDLMKEDMMKQQMLKRDMITQEIIKQDMITQEIIKQDIINLNQEIIKQDMITQEIIKQDIINLNQEIRKQDMINQEIIKQDMINQEIIKQDMINQEIIKQDIMSKMNPVETMASAAITNEKIDALVNCAVESHIANVSPNNYQGEQCEKQPQQQTLQMSATGNLQLSTTANLQLSTAPNLQLSTQDVLLNQHNSLLVPSIINTLSPNLIQSANVTTPHQSSSISPDVILNSQISPSLMCCTNTALAQDTFLSVTSLNTLCSTTSPIDTSLQSHLTTVSRMPIMSHPPPTSTNALQSLVPLPDSLPISSVSESEKSVYLNTALLESQNQIQDLTNSSKNNQNVQMLLNEHLANSLLATPTNNVLQGQELRHLSRNDNSFMQGNSPNPVMPFKSDASQTNLHQSNLHRTNLHETNLHQTNLHQTNLHETNLHQTNLHETNLHQTNLLQTNLHQPNLLQTNLHQTNLHQTTLNQPTLHQTTLHEDQKCEKKNEEIPSVFTTMTENELISIINPKCFDQGNSFN